MSPAQTKGLVWVAVGGAVVVIFILLMRRYAAALPAGSPQTAATPPTTPPLYAPGIVPPTFVFNPENVTLDQGNYSPGSCACACGQLDPGLTATFNNLTASFAASLTRDQIDFKNGLLASIPSWISNYYNNGNGLAMYNESLNALNAAA